MAYTIKENVRVDMRVNGETISVELEAGEQKLEPAIAELLVAQGIAVESKPKTSKTKTETSTEDN
jgi:uncharacterized protein YuzE